MTEVNVRRDPASLSLTVEARFDADVERVWALWADPRRLERWWFPPQHRATVVEHDLTAGGRVTYAVTAPDGAPMSGWWQVQQVAPPTSLGFTLGGPDIEPSDVTVTLAAVDGGTRMTVLVRFASEAAMEHLLDIGFDRGLANAVGQIPAALSAPAGP